MSSHEQQYLGSGFSILQCATLPQAPQNLRERAELTGKALGVKNEQIVKALALQQKPAAGASDAPGEPLLLLLLTDERLDLKTVSKLLGREVDYYPQDRIADIFGSPMNALCPLGAPEKKIAVAADGRVFDSDKIAVSSGGPLEEWLLDSDELRAFLGASLTLIDLETAKQGKSGIIEPRVLKGFRDYLPEEMLPRQEMIGKISHVFETFGFAPLQTPALEYSDILLGKLGPDAEKLLFRFRDNGGRDVCLRYDLTVPLARVAAQYQDLPKPFKRYQIAPVWRAENPGRGRFREFFQCDCDIVGSPSLIYDAECIALDFAVMQALGVKAEVRFNNRKVLELLDHCLNFTAAVDGPDYTKKMGLVFRTIDKLPSQGRERVEQLLKNEVGCNANQINTIMQFVSIAGDNNDEKLAALSAFFGDNATMSIREDVDAAIKELKTVLRHAADMCGSADGLKLDFSIARGLDYYTGTVYETFLTDLPDFGSVMSGGRYDGLIELYSGKPTPAVGISVGLDRLLAGLLELGRIKKCGATSRVMVVPMDAACVPPALIVLGQLRRAGIASEISLENDQNPKLDKQLSLAGKKGIPYAAILGSNEVGPDPKNPKCVMLKDLAARQQEELTVAQVIERLKQN
jgi:histidyl-tRNA synthetase